MSRIARVAAFSAMLLALADSLGQDFIPVPAAEIGHKYRLIGLLGKEIGTASRVQGVVLERNTKDAGTDFLVQRIDGRAILADLRLDLQPLQPYFEFGKKVAAGRTPLPQLEFGSTFEFDAYESFTSNTRPPREALDKELVVSQLPTHEYQTHLVAYAGHRIASIKFSPSDFVDREGLVDGLAQNRSGSSYVAAGNWNLLVKSGTTWPADIEGKLVEARGMVRTAGAPNEFRLEAGDAGLVRLEDQVGRKVALHGIAMCENGDHWYLVYRGIKLYIENMGELLEWSDAQRWHPVMIRGELARAKLPNIDEVTHKTHPKLVECFIVRNASWEPAEPLLGPELLKIEPPGPESAPPSLK